MSLFTLNSFDHEEAGDKSRKPSNKKLSKAANKNATKAKKRIKKKEQLSESSPNKKPKAIQDKVGNKMIKSKDKRAKKIKKKTIEKLDPLKNKQVANYPQNSRVDLSKIQAMLKKKSKTVDAKPESLRERMMAQLRASRFRYINETLYTNASSESRKMFKEDPDAFNAYHTGYRQQVEQWPLNPLDVIITSIKKMPADHIIADFGCGEARLADSVPQKVHSIDLVAVNDKVTACDMARTPLLIEGVHVVVFCLSLMGSNLNDYLLEANRILKTNGILKIADIESRFENVDAFIKSLEAYGFKNTWKDLSNNLFYFMDFKKIAGVSRGNKKLPQISLKSCMYKKR